MIKKVMGNMKTMSKTLINMSYVCAILMMK